MCPIVSPGFKAPGSLIHTAAIFFFEIDKRKRDNRDECENDRKRIEEPVTLDNSNKHVIR